MSGKNIEAIYPLSPMQHGLLFHTFCAPEAGLYIVQEHYTCEGELDVAIFERACRRVQDRHPALRSVFLQ